MDAIEILEKWISESKRMVFFGGAGVSTESGIPDFRGVDGLYRQEYDYPPEVILSSAFLRAQPAEFYRFYRRKMLVTDAQPNAAHEKLAKWEQAEKISAIITQNIDGLHQKAGAKNVCELHGSIYKNRCIACGKRYGVRTVLQTEGVPLCDCGGMIRPEVVLYGETLDDKVVTKALRAISQADLLLVGGTSLSVYPAAGFLDAYMGDRLVLINKTPTDKDDRADLILRQPIAALFAKLRV